VLVKVTAASKTVSGTRTSPIGLTVSEMKPTETGGTATVRVALRARLNHACLRPVSGTCS
jgi:hypothetical protein